MLPRYLISFAVLTLVFAAAYGAAIFHKNEDSNFTAELIEWLERAIEDEDDKHDVIGWAVIAAILKWLAGFVTGNCIKKIVAECSHSIIEFLPCAIKYIQDHQLECLLPGKIKSSHFNVLTKDMAF